MNSLDEYFVVQKSDTKYDKNCRQGFAQLRDKAFPDTTHVISEVRSGFFTRKQFIESQRGSAQSISGTTRVEIKSLSFLVTESSEVICVNIF